MEAYVECPGCGFEHTDCVYSLSIRGRLYNTMEHMPDYCARCCVMIMDKTRDCLDALEALYPEHYEEVYFN